jgi:small-conductance mechanosensitive channel
VDFNQLLNDSLTFYQKFSVNIYITVIIMAGYFVISRLTRPKIEESVESSRFKHELSKKARHSANLILIILTIPLIMFVWGFDFRNLLLVSTGIFTLAGVALFANWSILSNITAFFIIILHSSFRRGNFIRIIEQDNFIAGYIADVNLFNTRLITEDREVIIYPNNLIISRPTIINPRNQYSAIGKITDFTSINDQSSD